MKVIVDKKIPFLKGVLDPYMDIEYLSGSEITNDVLTGVDALIIRTRTKCDARLLEGSSVKFIASATIGYDHIDTDYCNKHGIYWTNAPGCNSGSVMQYIAFCLLHYAEKNAIDLRDRVMGVIGVGNVGRKIVKLAEIFEMQVLLNDPPRERAEGPCGFISLQGILREADIISLHVPLTMEGNDRTFHLIDEEVLAKINPGTLLINSSRGEVIHTEQLKKSLKLGFPSAVILDVWEDEPNIDQELMNAVFYATPHIAGYSADGKANGTRMSVQALSRFFKIGLDDWEPDTIPEPENPIISCNGLNKDFQEIATEIIMQTYNYLEDERKLKTVPESFEKIRENYPLRREFSAFTIDTVNISDNDRKRLMLLGFRVIK